MNRDDCSAVLVDVQTYLIHGQGWLEQGISRIWKNLVKQRPYPAQADPFNQSGRVRLL